MRLIQCPLDARIGVIKHPEYVVLLCHFESKSFKTRAGAEKFLRKAKLFFNEKFKAAKGDDIKTIKDNLTVIDWQIQQLEGV